MSVQTLTAAAIGFALSLSVAGAAAQSFDDYVRGNVAVPSRTSILNEIECDPRVCGNPPEFGPFDRGDIIDYRQIMSRHFPTGSWIPSVGAGLP